MPETQSTDLVVLGGGPGGYAAAFLAADRGIATTLIDASPRPGGTCLYIGCIPSKTLLHAAHLIHAAHDAGDFGLKFAPPEIDLDKLRAKTEKVVDMMTGSLLKGCKDRGINHVVGRGAFVDAHAIQVEKGPTVKFKNCIIAVGSVPARLPAFDIGSKRILDSTSAPAPGKHPQDAARGRRRLHRAGARQRLFRAWQQSHRRRDDRRPPARRRCRSGPPAARPAARSIRENLSANQGRQNRGSQGRHQGVLRGRSRRQGSDL